MWLKVLPDYGKCVSIIQNLEYVEDLVELAISIRIEIREFSGDSFKVTFDEIEVGLISI